MLNRTLSKPGLHRATITYRGASFSVVIAVGQAPKGKKAETSAAIEDPGGMFAFHATKQGWAVAKRVGEPGSLRWRVDFPPYMGEDIARTPFCQIDADHEWRIKWSGPDGRPASVTAQAV
jgi:hypothetical protein